MIFSTNYIKSVIMKRYLLTILAVALFSFQTQVLLARDQEQSSSKIEQIKEVAEQLKQEFIKELGVDDAQANQLVALTAEHNIQKSIINQVHKSNAVARSQKMNELNQKTNRKVRKILNEQQYKKFLIILLKSERAGK